jgi:hypothetical protein
VLLEAGWRGIRERKIGNPAVVKFHFKMGSEFDEKQDFFVAAHHWAPSLIS